MAKTTSAERAEKRCVHITEQQRLQVTGLLAVASSLRQRLRDVEDALGDVLSVPADTSGYRRHVTDVVWGDASDADDLLTRLDQRNG